MIECVVETGSSKYVATSSHVPAAVSAQNIPYIRISGSSSNSSLVTIPFLIVSVTPRPSSRAPRNCTNQHVSLWFMGPGRGNGFVCPATPALT